MSDCSCSRTEVRERTIRGGAIQHIRQCLDCGQPVGGAVKQAGIVKKFDEEMRTSFVKSQLDEREQQRLADSAAWKKTYAAYLASTDWASLRGRVFDRDEHLCQGCLQAPATEVHHITYANVGHEFAFELLSLCAPCHSRFHEKDVNE